MEGREYNIVVIDNDYRAVAYTEVKCFPSEEDAKKYCEERTWDGYTFYLD